MAFVLLLLLVLPPASYALNAKRCMETCKDQLDLVQESLAKYSPLENGTTLSAAKKCLRACHRPASICQDLPACQKDPACLVRCWMENQTLTGGPWHRLSQFQTCTRAQIHRSKVGFTLSSRFFWLPLNFNVAQDVQNSTSQSQSYRVEVGQRAFHHQHGNCELHNAWTRPPVLTDQPSISLSELMGHERDCFSYQYYLKMLEKDEVQGRLPIGKPATLHTYGLCDFSNKLHDSEAECYHNARQCDTSCPEAKQTCRQGEIADILKNEDGALPNTIDLYPEISVMSFEMRRVSVCTLPSLGKLRLNTTAVWWPGFPGYHMHDCLVRHLPSCWCYSSCDVRFEARIQIGNWSLSTSATVSDAKFMESWLKLPFGHEEGPYASNIVLDFPYEGSEAGFEGAPVTLSLRAHYVSDVLGPKRAKWKRVNVSNTCRKPGENISAFEGAWPHIHLLSFTPRLDNNTLLGKVTPVPDVSRVPLNLNVVWTLEGPSGDLARCFLGYNKCWCQEDCRVTLTTKLNRLGERGSFLAVEKTAVHYSTLSNFTKNNPGQRTFSMDKSMWVESTQGQDVDFPGKHPITITVEASFAYANQEPTSLSRVFQGDWRKLIRDRIGGDLLAADGSSTITPDTTPTVALPQAGSGSSLAAVVAPIMVCLAALFLLILAGVVRYRKKVRESKVLSRMAQVRQDSLTDSAADRKNLSLLLKNSFQQTSSTTLLSSPMKTEKVNYNYIPMDKLLEAASKGNWTCFPPQLEFPVDQLNLERQLGTGQFGCVWLAKAFRIEEDQEWTHVAVKMLKDDSPEKDAEDFLKEAQHLSKFHHANIVQLLGVVVHGNPKMVVLEYMNGGDLLAFMQRHKPHANLWNDTDFVNIALDIASGLRYLESKGFVHRDVAARNCLIRLPPLSSSKKISITKIADFGLARDVHGSECYTLVHKDALLPVRWMAPESVTKAVFTHASDVWSFGILMWELYTFGDMPYAECGPSHAVAARISSGGTLDQPSNCPKRMYAMMKSCWSRSQKSRPSFSHLHDMLHSYKKGFARRSTKSTALTLSTLGSTGEYLANGGGTVLDQFLTQSVTCPPIVFEDCDSISPSPEISRCSCHTTSTSIFERSPRLSRRTKLSSRLGSDMMKCRTPASLSDCTAGDGGSVFNEEPATDMGDRSTDAENRIP